LNEVSDPAHQARGSCSASASPSGSVPLRPTRAMEKQVAKNVQMLFQQINGNNINDV